MLWLSGVEAGARLLSFGFYLIAARVFKPDGFGVIQYTITVATLAFGGLQVLVTALIRELGATRGDDVATREVLGSSLAVASVLWGLTSVLCLLAQSAGLARTADTLGLLATVGGMAALQLYFSISRGLGHPRRQAASYAGASMVQLLTFGLLALFTHPSPTEALIVFGVSSLVPVVLYEWRAPVLRGQGLSVSRAVLRRLWIISAPLLVAQIGYLLWNSLDQLWVQQALGTFKVGVYASAKNISQGMLVIPAGTAGVLLPRVSELRSRHDAAGARRLVVLATAGAFVIALVVAGFVAGIRSPLLGDLYGSAYRRAADPLAIMCVGMACWAGFGTLTMAVVGWGRPHVYTIGISVAAVAEALILLVVHGHGLMTAAIASAGSMAVAFLIVCVGLAVRPPWACDDP